MARDPGMASPELRSFWGFGDGLLTAICFGPLCCSISAA
jgi:hypothetical protein